MILIFKTISGKSAFTLIEVLVVLIIAALGISLVAPRLFSAYETVMASVEEQRLADAFERVKMKAFLRKTAYEIEVDGSSFQIKDEDVTLEFEFLQFPPAAITFNGNGFPDTETITYFVRGIDRVLDVS